MAQPPPRRPGLRHNEEAANISVTVCPLRMAGGRGLSASRPVNLKFDEANVKQSLGGLFCVCLLLMTGVPGRKGAVEVDIQRVMRNLVVKNQ